MKAFNAILTLFLLIFTISFSSAAIVSYAEWPDQSSSAIITNGDSIDFSAYFSANPHPMQVSVILYDSSYNILNTFYSSNVNSDFFSQTFTITQNMYSSAGSYEVIVVGEDNNGNANSHTIYLTVNGAPTPVDNTAPVITLLGDNPQLIQLGNPYIEQSATATDDVDGDLTNQIVIDSSLVNTNSVGLYIVSYSVSDSSGNSATAFRTVNVTNSPTPVDNTAPVITLLGDNPQSIKLGTPYTELGATATDDVDGNLTNQIMINISEVNTSAEGLYNVTYNVQDSSGNNATEVTRVVNVTANQTDDTAPIITVISPEDAKAYKTKQILFEVKVNENATVFYNLNSGDNITMYETTPLVFEHGRILAYGDYNVTFYAIDTAGNLATEMVSFSVEKASIPKSKNSSIRREKNETAVNYFEAGVRNNTASEISFDNNSASMKLGYIVLFLLSLGIIILVLLIILIVKAKEEEKKTLSKEYAEIFKDDEFD